MQTEIFWKKFPTEVNLLVPRYFKKIYYLQINTQKFMELSVNRVSLNKISVIWEKSHSAPWGSKEKHQEWVYKYIHLLTFFLAQYVTIIFILFLRTIASYRARPDNQFNYVVYAFVIRNLTCQGQRSKTLPNKYDVQSRFQEGRSKVTVNQRSLVMIKRKMKTYKYPHNY